MTNNKQSSIEFIFSEMYNIISFYAGDEQDVLCEKIKEQAQAMHEEEIEDAFQEGKWDWSEHITNGTESKDLTQYYNETFGGNK